MLSRLVEIAPGMSIMYSRPHMGVVLDSRVIEANGKIFSLLEASITESDGEVSFKKLEKALEKVAAAGGLHGEPKRLVAIDRSGNPIHANVSYWDAGIVGPRIAKIMSFGREVWPSLDDFFTYLTVSEDPGRVAPIIVLDKSVKIEPYGHNREDDSVPRVDRNPFSTLGNFIGREYDGSLGIRQLEKFIGFTFGNMQEANDGGYAYVYNIIHRGRDLGGVGFTQETPKIGDKMQMFDSDWEVQAIEHKGFKKGPKITNKKKSKGSFTQEVALALKHLQYNPPLTPSQKRARIVEEDRLFWYTLTARHNLGILEIPPLYTGKSPITPWYRTNDPVSGATFTMGWRKRVDEIGLQFRKPVDANILNNAFGNVNTTTYTNDHWSGKGIHSEAPVSSFVIHCWQREDTSKYFSQLLGIARSKSS